MALRQRVLRRAEARKPATDVFAAVSDSVRATIQRTQATGVQCSLLTAKVQLARGAQAGRCASNAQAGARLESGSTKRTHQFSAFAA